MHGERGLADAGHSADGADHDGAGGGQGVARVARIAAGAVEKGQDLLQFGSAAGERRQVVGRLFALTHFLAPQEDPVPIIHFLF
ncbi:hypothetical protein, partial [Streptomyces scabiei]|uniref:hypothetical protein n=1 Tax=Streptomyces scabiei TaxID=1930 RepID=UPI0029A2B75D